MKRRRIVYALIGLLLGACLTTWLFWFKQRASYTLGEIRLGGREVVWPGEDTIAAGRMRKALSLHGYGKINFVQITTPEWVDGRDDVAREERFMVAYCAGGDVVTERLLFLTLIYRREEIERPGGRNLPPHVVRRSWTTRCYLDISLVARAPRGWPLPSPDEADEHLLAVSADLQGLLPHR